MSLPAHTYGFWFYKELLTVLGKNKLITMATPACGQFLVTGSSPRLKCLIRSPKCVGCGLEGVMWMLQSHGPLNPKNESRPHLNLYADTRGGWRLMTQDHIFPKSKGGSNELVNLQTMCSACNQAKADKVPDECEVETVFGDPRGVDERRLRIARLRALEAYADYLAGAERKQPAIKLTG